jgi:hypothetical protein
MRTGFCPGSALAGACPALSENAMGEDIWSKDMLDFMQKMWNPLGFPLPGMVAPTIDVGEIERKLVEMRSVENWLKMNLGLLQMTIKTLEMQKAALESLSGATPEGKPGPGSK